MRSRIFKALLAIIAPLVLDYIVKKLTGKKEEKKQLPTQP